jgi:hypothetical protein
VNNYKLILNVNSTKELNIPIQMDWDYLDRSDSLIDFEQKTINEIINNDKDFEVERFSHAGNLNDTEINYNFYFAPSGATSANTIWDKSYITQGFTPNQIYYSSNSFVRSFFKLDFYDTTNQKDQKNYFTIILTPPNSITPEIAVATNFLNVKIPTFKMDYIGNKEGFFIYWLKNRDFINIDTFYMTAKFFDAKNGIFYKMMNRPQSTLSGINKFNFSQENYFYYKVKLDYSTYQYSVYDINNPLTEVLVGDSLNPIKWYEYINP